MKLFNKRPLSLILCVWLVGLFVFSSSSAFIKILLALLSLSVFGVSFIPKVRRIVPHILPRVCTLAFALSMIFALIFFDFVYSPVTLYGTEIYGTGHVSDIKQYSSITVYEIQTQSINGIDGANYKFNAKVYGEGNPQVEIGSRIDFEAEISEFSQNDEFKTYYKSNGIFAEVDKFEICAVSQGNYKDSIEYYFKSVRINFTENAIKFFGEDAGALFSALILGERGNLSDRIELDFSRVGITHILALSGMHLVILTGVIEKLLVLLSVKKSARNIIKVALIVIYMSLTGFPASVVRASIMVIITLLLFLLHNKSDSVTSLFVSVSAIVLFNPYAIFDLSLILSFISTLGVIIGANVYNEFKISKKSKFRPILISLLTSLFAIASTLIVVGAQFGRISIISPISTLVFAFVIEIFMYLGIALYFINPIIPLGIILELFGNLIISAVSVISDVSFIFTSINAPIFKLFIVAFTIALAVFVVFDIKNKKRYLIYLAVALCTLLIVAPIYSKIGLCFDDIVYYYTNDDEHVIVKSVGQVSIIDHSSHTSKSYRVLEDKLLENDVSYIDKYILPAYSKRMLTGLDGLLGRIKVKEVYIPSPKNPDEIELYNKISDLCGYYDIEIGCYKTVEKISCGNISVFETDRSEYGSGTQIYTMAYLYKDNVYTHFSNGAITNKNYDTADELITSSNACIFGSRGRKYEIMYEIMKKYDSLEKIIISSEEIVISKSLSAFYGEKIVYYPKRISLIR